MNKVAVTYDDIYLIPQFSEIESRLQPDTSCMLGEFKLSTPIVSANMDTVTGSEMAIALYRMGAVGALHRFNTVDENVEEYRRVRNANADCFVTVGASDYKTRLEATFALGARHFIVDIAHGHSLTMRKILEHIRNQYKYDIFVIAGNVATGEAILDLANWGADVVKVGVGGGSICKTRVVTGHGVPNVTALQNCSQVADELGIKLVADGGIRSSGDIVKALIWADYVMLGSLLAGTVETPGEVIDDGHIAFKMYRGMASDEAQKDYFGESRSVKPAAEGVSTRISYKGPVRDVVEELTGGIRSGMSYMNARALEEIKTKAMVGIQTFASTIEGQPHILNKR